MARDGKEDPPTVLVVEDEFIIAIDRELPDCAILDVYTGDGEVYPLADALAEAGVPIIFHSGHVAPEDVLERYPHALACSKPCPPDHLIDLLTEAVDRAKSNGHALR